MIPLTDRKSKYTIRPVRTKGDLKRFVDLPFVLYGDDPKWVPPLKGEVRKMLTPGRHPFWERADRELFLLMDGDRVAGRIAAIEDRNYNAYHEDTSGKWGFFECVNDQAGADLLFDAAETWLRERGLTYMHGPFNPSTNYEIGLLIEGWETPPVLMMTYNPEYYLGLIENTGHAKEKDLHAYLFEADHEMPAWVGKLSQRVLDKTPITTRQVDMKRLDQEVRLMNELYRAAWADNWGFVPATDAEIAIQAKEMKAIIDPEFAVFLYDGDEPVGVSVVLPDANYLLKILNGRLNPFSLWKALRHRSKMVGTRFILLGIKPGYRGVGVPLVALDQVMRRFAKAGKYQYMEVSWTLEDNVMINSLIDKLGGRLYKRYRIYRKEF